MLFHIYQLHRPWLHFPVRLWSLGGCKNPARLVACAHHATLMPAVPLTHTTLPFFLSFDVEAGADAVDPQLFRKTVLKGGYAPADDFETDQVFALSKDGTAVPMFVVHRKGAVRDGARPTLLYGYGGGDAFCLNAEREAGSALQAARSACPPHSSNLLNPI